jgi:hypothetical protein
MNRDIEQEKKELLRKIDETIDPKLREILDRVANVQETRTVNKIVMSTEGTTNASTK